MKESFQNWLIVFSIIVVSGVILHFALPEKESVENPDVMGVESVDYKNTPYITSVSPTSMYVGESFRYEIKVSDLDDSDESIEVYLEESPDWMYLEGRELLGYASVAGTYKYILTVTDGINSSSQINYILVESNE
jgi:hypothetical protein